jgi:hypothetical protein
LGGPGTDNAAGLAHEQTTLQGWSRNTEYSRASQGLDNTARLIQEHTKLQGRSIGRRYFMAGPQTVSTPEDVREKTTLLGILKYNTTRLIQEQTIF